MLIGVDFGLKRTGVAVTDSSMIIASPLDTVHSSQIIQFLSVFTLVVQPIVENYYFLSVTDLKTQGK